MAFTDLPDLKRRYTGQAGQLVNEFYLPVIREAVLYDRQAGYFNSAWLVLVAAGLAAFIRRARQAPAATIAPMRLVTGATWSEEDVAAYRRGHDALNACLDRTLLRQLELSDERCRQLGLPPGWRAQEDQIARNRLGTLAWMVAAGLLEVRVALPLDSDGRPCAPGFGGALYHPKAGILYDAAGNVLFFQGSINETSAAWTRNREKFEVKRSWYSEQDREDIQAEIGEFETLWTGRDSGLLVLPLPRAVQDYLSDFVPPEGPPERDPMENVPAVVRFSPEERAQARALLEAPRRPGGERLVLEPLWADGAPLRPFPHQERVIRRATTAFPQSFLFCDEVGLGKTIEAGLALRTLWLGGQVRRALIVAPRSLIRQWQEELREKLALTAWFYDGNRLIDVAGRVRLPEHPLSETGILIVSRHLIARQDRRAEVARAHPWDLMIVDEAHAARRKAFQQNEPNQLLDLLQDFKHRRQYRCLWLLTATPMQLAVREVHDLLRLCGLDDPQWDGWATLAGFEDFFHRLQRFARDRNEREPVVAMTRIAVDQGAPDFDDRHAPPDWEAFRWQSLVRRIRSGTGRLLALQDMSEPQARALEPMLARQTPLAVHMFRHTRATLRAYQERGLIRGLVRRIPEDVPVAFETEPERRLYLRIDELCGRFYRLADLPPEERRGLGFLMAVFRKRLASSFAALCRSLERRRDLIEAIQHDLDHWEARLLDQQALYDEETDDDEENDAGEALTVEARRMQRLYGDPRRRSELESERQYLQDYIAALRRIDRDSKFAVFQERLKAIVDAGHRVIVFTQYLDTLDFIRERLVVGFGDRLACYSGRGGEIWNPAYSAWRVVEKAQIKARCSMEHPQALRVLLGTDAASEGLNLQQFSALVNYDLPWNPMRVEQRIGRIDRIGQQAPTVHVYNLYLQGTIEEDAYDTLKNRIHVFEEVVGPLQPILAEMPRIFRRLARGEMELMEARRQLDEAARRPPDSAIAEFEKFVEDDLAATSGGDPPPAPATQERLAAWCLAHPAPGMHVEVVPEPGSAGPMPIGSRACLSITWLDSPRQLGIEGAEAIVATFNGELADRHPPTVTDTGDALSAAGYRREGVRLLTWGDPYLEAWLGAFQGKDGGLFRTTS